VRCVDCREEIRTYERPDVQACRRCLGEMHGECAMSDWNERPVCEACLRHLEFAYVDLMRSKSKQAGRKRSRGRQPGAQPETQPEEVDDASEAEGGVEPDDELEPWGGDDCDDRLVH
jgi:hypothetical protein